MADSMFMGQETASYITPIGHPHNGYYAGDLSRGSRSWSALRVCYAGRRGMPCAELITYGAQVLAASAALASSSENRRLSALPPQRGL